MFNLRRLLALLILISIVALTTVIYRHLQQQDPEELLSMLPDNIDLALEDLHYTQNEDGQRRWTLDADTAEYQRDSSLAELEVVKLLFYDAGQFGDINLQADHGQLTQDTRQVDIWGRVRLKTERSEQLFTERLHYDDQNRQLSTEDSIRFLSPRLELTGTGLQIDIDQGRMLVKDNVWVLLYPAGREKDK
ncbi:MAG: LPS export ABC transporter periplasmic protein LptC [Thermodesulfobacteriota bacterium]|nr:LPS export ABC transporter periplasmic protein LptC [Thermodesulfobacteriota bacterium]